MELIKGKEDLKKLIDDFNSKDITFLCSKENEKILKNYIKEINASYNIKIIENKMVATDTIYVMRSNDINNPLYYKFYNKKEND